MIGQSVDDGMEGLRRMIIILSDVVRASRACVFQVVCSLRVSDTTRRVSKGRNQPYPAVQE